MFKGMESKLFPLMQILGCVALYISIYGNFAISGLGVLLAVPVAAVLGFFDFRATRLRGRLANKGLAVILFAICYLAVLYIPLISHGAIYAVHKVIGAEKFILAESDVTATHGVGGRLCRREIVLTYPGGRQRAHCISREFYNKYLSVKKFGYRLPVAVVVNESFLGRSLVSLTLLDNEKSKEIARY